MACRDGRDDWGPTERAMDSENSALRNKSTEIQKRLDNTAALLCGLMTVLTEEHPAWDFTTRVPGLAAWWKEHQEHDRQRLRGEISSELYKLPLDKLREIEKLIGGEKK